VTYPTLHSKFLPNILSPDIVFAEDAHTADEQVYDQHETKKNFWVSELAHEDQQRPKRRTIYYELGYQMTVDKSSKTVQKLPSSILKASDNGTLLKALPVLRYCSPCTFTVPQRSSSNTG
jgi:hypothetical protein